jgi:hypothetical protein
MRSVCFLLVFYTLFHQIAPAQTGFSTAGGANFLGFGRAGVNIGGIAALYMNQAGLTEVNDFAFDLSAEKRFNLEELTSASLAIAKRTGAGTFGLMFSRFGFDAYSENKLGLAYARKLMDNLSVGGQFDILGLNIAGYGNDTYFTFEAGLNYVINNEFSIATHIFSPGNIVVADGTNLGSRFRMGLKYSPSLKVFLLAEVDKVIDRQFTEFKFGISYKMAKELELRFGANPSALLFTLGVAANFSKKYTIAGAYGMNNVIGNTPSISFSYDR